MIWAIAVGLSLASVVAMLLTLRRQPGAVLARRDGAAAILADQMSEINRDLGRDLISEVEAEGARNEIKRRLLRLERQTEAEAVGSGGAPALIGLSLAVPMLAFALYAWMGNPGVPAMPFASRAAEQVEATQIADLAAQLKARLLAKPDGGETRGWELLAQTYMRMERFRDAADIQDRLKDRADATSATFSRLAEALIAAENGIVTPPAQLAIDRALAMEPDNPAATYYRAFALEQIGQPKAAYDLLTARLKAETGFAPWMETYVAHINRLAEATGQPAIDPGSLVRPTAPGPSPDEVAAASEMSADDRDAFIRAMVARLAERLEGEPDDLDGWLRLASAYSVLGEAGKSRKAYDRAVDLSANLPYSDSRGEAARAGLEAHGG